MKKKDIEPISDYEGLINKITNQKLEERTKNLINKEDVLKELKLCLDLEMHERGLILLENLYDKKILDFKTDAELLLYYLKFLNIRGSEDIIISVLN